MQQLSPTRLSLYHRCPQAYYLRYHRKAPGSAGRQPVLGRALHKCLAKLYTRPGWQGIPSVLDLDQLWLDLCHSETLDTGLAEEGRTLLRQYHARFIAPLSQWRQPIGVEGRVEAILYCEGIEFRLQVRYDRLDYLPIATPDQTAQIHLIDYKSGRTDPEPLEQDLQMGLYQIAIEQTYGHSLQQVSHIYLRSGAVVSYTTTPLQRQQLHQKVREIAQTLLEDREFVAKPGPQCRSCSCRSYCPAGVSEPLPLAERDIPLQLSLLA